MTFRLIHQRRSRGTCSLFSQIVTCDSWQAARTLRRLARFEITGPLNALIRLYDRTEEMTFRAPGAPFYWLAARLWTMIAFDRIAEETPKSIASHGTFLATIATDDTLPHVLIGEFAKNAAIKLVNCGVFSANPKRLAAVRGANSGTVKRKKPPKGYDPSKTFFDKSRSTERFHFDHIDTIPYWYEPAVRAFADVKRDEFILAAEKWIVDEWQGPTGVVPWRDDPRAERFSGYRWNLFSNDHGSRPIIERYSTYLEWHAMWCGAGTLMRTRALAQSEGDAYSGIEGLIRGDYLSRPPLWLADFRGPKPLDPQLWAFTETDMSLDTVDDRDFLREVGVASDNHREVIVEARCTTKSSEFRSTVEVRSALVQPETAAALMAALQTIDEPYRYRIPFDGEHDSSVIDDPPYRLLGWLAAPYRDSGSTSATRRAMRSTGIGSNPAVPYGVA